MESWRLCNTTVGTAPTNTNAVGKNLPTQPAAVTGKDGKLPPQPTCAEGMNFMDFGKLAGNHKEGRAEHAEVFCGNQS